MPRAPPANGCGHASTESSNSDETDNSPYKDSRSCWTSRQSNAPKSDCAGDISDRFLQGVRKVLADPERRRLLGVEADAVVVLLSTEGRAANPKTQAR